MQCTLVEPWIYGHTECKFVGEKETSKVPLLTYRHCTNDAVVDEYLEGYQVHHCSAHATGKTERPIHKPERNER